MTNNTIHNVPRELMERIIQFRWIADDLEVKDCRKELRALLSAPSPAGVDGLEVALSSEQILEVFERNGFRIELGAQFSARGQIAQLLNAVGEIERLSDATAIIDGLRGEVYDEEKERALFEVSLDPAVYPSASVFGVDSLDPGQYCDPNLERRWRGWLACAKSRALSAVCAAAPNIATTSEHSGS